MKSNMEKQFYRVLVSSVFGILLCLACLVGTTWAWFTVDVAVNENQVQLANWQMTATVHDGMAPVAPVDGSYLLSRGNYRIELRFDSDAVGDAYTAAETVYIVMTEEKSGNTAQYSAKLTLPAANTYVLDAYPVEDTAKLSFYFTRTDPGATDLSGVSFTPISFQTAPPETTEAATKAATEPTQAATEETEAAQNG